MSRQGAALSYSEPASFTACCSKSYVYFVFPGNTGRFYADKFFDGYVPDCTRNISDVFFLTRIQTGAGTVLG